MSRILLEFVDPDLAEPLPVLYAPTREEVDEDEDEDDDEQGDKESDDDDDDGNNDGYSE